MLTRLKFQPVRTVLFREGDIVCYGSPSRSYFQDNGTVVRVLARVLGFPQTYLVRFANDHHVLMRERDLSLIVLH